MLMILGPFCPVGEAASVRASSRCGLGAEPESPLLLFRELNWEAAACDRCRLADVRGGDDGLSSPSAGRLSVVEKKCRGVLVGY